MKFGTTIRNMGAAATTENITHCARHAEEIGLDHVWVVDHVAIPPNDAEGSDGRWFDPLATLAYLAACTSRIQLGVSVLVLPYRPALLTAKWIATIQELSGNRFHLGIGPGWMAAEFKALGVNKAERGKLTDQTIDFIRSCFESSDEIVSANGQDFLFRPNPDRPPIYVGGMTDTALERAVRIADGWLPMGIDPEKLAPRITRLRELADAAGKPCPEIITIGTLPDDDDLAVEQLRRCRDLGMSQYIQASRYNTAEDFEQIMARVVSIREQLLN